MATQNLAICDVCRTQRPTENLFQCSTCRPGGNPLFFCATHCSETDCNHAELCVQDGHESCWDSHLPKKGRQKHEKIDAFPDYLARLILHSEPNNEIQAQMHERDRKAEWFTVSSGPFEDSEATVQVTERFRKLCNPRYVNNRSSSESYPSLVSFIGDTGAGKSTLVNAMSVIGQIQSQIPRDAFHPGSTPKNSIQRPSNLPKVEQARREGPVTRSGDPRRATEPTSSGVHLYLDPGVNRVRYHPSREEEAVPILYADCEGFRGGTNKTNAERSVHAPGTNQSRRSSTSSLNRRPSGTSWSTGRNITNELEITLPEIKSAGKSGAELYYARFLYAFSDVIVFVTNNDQQLHQDIQRLLEWALSAVHKAINHPPRKTLIIVQNMPARHDSGYYSEFHKRSLLGSMDNVWETSKSLDSFKKRHDKESLFREREIHSNEQFLKIFFQSIEVCYIPNKGFATAADVVRQYRVLRNHITQAVEAGQQARSVSWTRYDVPSLSHLFGRAFHHFAKISGPFDFYTAARKDNPMSGTLADHIANLLRYMQLSEVRLNEFPAVVAVCLISFVHRNFRQAIEPKEIFDRTLRRVCAKAIQTYQNKYQRCAFVFPPDGKRCEASRLTHPEHCSLGERGMAISGNFDGSDYYEAPSDTVRKIELSFISMFKELCSHLAGGSVLRLPPSHEVAKYRQTILNSKPIADSKFWQKAKSNKTCLACLQSVPDHALPCGHVYCEQCVTEFGQLDESERYCIEMTRCVLCLSEWPSGPPQLIRKKPKFAGVRVLTLDGGGVRGIIELTILAEIEHRVGLGAPIRELFDLIVGTSTGGIIALGVAMTDNNLDQMSQKFLELSERTFRTNRGGILSKFDPLNIFPAVLMAVKAWESKYRTAPLREGLVNIFGENKSMFPATTFNTCQRNVRVAVTSTTSGEPCIFSNYNRLVSTDNKDFEREDEQSKEAKVWEAALATSAAPIYFKPFERGYPPKLYSDGALHANLPADYALWETKKIWPQAHTAQHTTKIPVYDFTDKDFGASIEALDVGEEQIDEFDGAGNVQIQATRGAEVHVDTLVSIGTGKQQRADKYPSAFEVGGLKQAYLLLIKAMDTEASWEEFRRKGSKQDLHQFRLNVPLTGKYVSLDDWEQMHRLIEVVRETYRTSSAALNEVQDVAAKLVASLLFFEPDTFDSTRLRAPEKWHRIHGQIWCRLPRDSASLVALTDRISNFWVREDNPRMAFSQPVKVPLKDGWKSEIRTQGKHLSIPMTIRTMEPDSTITLSVRLKDIDSLHDLPGISLRERVFPISGFPLIYKDLEAKVTAQ